MLEQERRLLAGGGGRATFVLTTHRLTYSTPTSVGVEETTVFLDAVSTITLRTASAPWLVVLAACLFLLGIGSAMMFSEPLVAVPGTLIGAVLVALYYRSRRASVVVGAAGGTLEIPIGADGAEQAPALLAQIANARDLACVRRDSLRIRP